MEKAKQVIYSILSYSNEFCILSRIFWVCQRDYKRIDLLLKCISKGEKDELL